MRITRPLINYVSGQGFSLILVINYAKNEIQYINTIKYEYFLPPKVNLNLSQCLQLIYIY